MGKPTYRMSFDELFERQGNDRVTRYNLTLNEKTVHKGVYISPDDTIGGVTTSKQLGVFKWKATTAP